MVITAEQLKDLLSRSLAYAYTVQFGKPNMLLKEHFPFLQDVSTAFHAGIVGDKTERPCIDYHRRMGEGFMATYRSSTFKTNCRQWSRNPLYDHYELKYVVMALVRDSVNHLTGRDIIPLDPRVAIKAFLCLVLDKPVEYPCCLPSVVMP